MMTKRKVFQFVLLSLGCIGFFGCSGGGGGSSSSATIPTSPELSVLPANFDFGVVTDVNSVEPLNVTVQNTGTASLLVSGITLPDAENFILDLNGGDSPCASATPSIDPAGSCTLTVDFVPQDVVLPPEGIDYNAVLTIQSNDPTTPSFDLGLAGKRQNITKITVKINQIDACPRVVDTPVKAYVSVTDQGGFQVTTLNASDFTLVEADTNRSVDGTLVNDSVTLSVALLMDYSYSITQEPDNVTDMENATINFISQLGSNDEAEIIKYASTIDVAQEFTSDTTRLTDAIQSPTSLGGQTALYDAIARAIDDISSRTKDRSAIIIITDGEDNDGTGNPLSDNTLADVIAQANANGIPVFTVGLGDRVDPTLLQQLADDTGGIFSDATTSDNLITVYQQLANLIFTDQYILTYQTGLGNGDPRDLVVTATYAPGIADTDTKAITACP